MKVPNHDLAQIPLGKLTAYLLSESHPKGRHKARLFRAFGFSDASPGEFAAALLAHLATNDVTETDSTLHGVNHVVDGPLVCPDGRQRTIRVIWFVANGASSATLATAYPIKP